MRFVILLLIALSVPLHSQTFDYALTFTNANSDQSCVQGIAPDGSGGVFVCGWSFGDLDFNPLGTPVQHSEQATNGYGDGFFGRYDASGQVVWMHAFGSGYNDSAADCASDSAGNLYVTGSTGGAIDLEPGPGTYLVTAPPAGQHRGFVAKYSPSGALLWFSIFTADTVVPAKLALGPGGEVFVATVFEGDLSWAGPMIIAQSSYINLGLLKFNAGGSPAWAATIEVPITGNLSATDLVADSQGRVTLACEAWGGVTFTAPSGTITPTPANFDIYVWQLNAAGSSRWLHQIGSNDQSIACAFAVEPDDGVTLLARISAGVVDFDPSSAQALLDVTQGQNAAIVRYTADGAFRGLKPFESIGAVAWNCDMAIDATGTYIAFDGSMNLGTADERVEVYNSVGGMVGAFDPNGNLRWAARTAQATCLARIGTSQLAIAGTLNYIGALDLDPGTGQHALSGHGGFIQSLTGIMAGNLVHFSGNPPPPAYTLSDYSHQFSSAGGSGPTHTYHHDSGNVPPGLLFQSPALYGRATTPGQYTFSVAVIDSDGMKATRTFTMDVIDGKAPNPGSKDDEGCAAVKAGAITPLLLPLLLYLWYRRRRLYVVHA